MQLLNQYACLCHTHSYHFHEEWDAHISLWTFRKEVASCYLSQMFKYRQIGFEHVGYHCLSPNSPGQQKLNRAHNSCLGKKGVGIKEKRAKHNINLIYNFKWHHSVIDIKKGKSINTLRLFWRGVPLIMIRWAQGISCKLLALCVLGFFMRCPW